MCFCFCVSTGFCVSRAVVIWEKIFRHALRRTRERDFIWSLLSFIHSKGSTMIKTRYTRSRYYPSVFIARYVLRSISFQVNLIAGAVDNTAGLKLHSFSVVLSSMRSPEWRDWGLPDSRNLRILFVRIISAFIEQNRRLGSWAALGIQTFTLSCDFLNSVWSQSYSIMSMSKIVTLAALPYSRFET